MVPQVRDLHYSELLNQTILGLFQRETGPLSLPVCFVVPFPAEEKLLVLPLTCPNNLVHLLS